MRVDILVSGSPPGGANANLGSITRTLLQNIEVLSAGQNYQKDAEGKPVLVQVVNLLVTPQQAEILNLATDQKIQLVLRNPADQEVVQTPGAASASLFAGGVSRLPMFGEAAAPAMPHAPSAARVRTDVPTPQPKPNFDLTPRRVTVEVFAGSKKMESTFNDPATPVVQP
jgi:pilus assembly protein CpaB